MQSFVRCILNHIHNLFINNWPILEISLIYLFSNWHDSKKFGSEYLVEYLLSAESLVRSFYFYFYFFFHFFYLTNKNWFRMEKLTLRSRITQAKIIGAIVSISGALLVVLYKGPAMFLTSPSTHSKPLLQWPLCSSLSNWVTGGLLLIAQSLLNSIWYILQV